jgi:hypothetical protein
MHASDQYVQDKTWLVLMVVQVEANMRDRFEVEASMEGERRRREQKKVEM